MKNILTPTEMKFPSALNKMHEYTLIRSNRKTISLEVGRDLSVTVRAPLKMPKRDIDIFVARHQKWVNDKLAVMSERQNSERSLSSEETAELKKRAAEIIPERVAYFSEIMGLAPTSVKITSAKKRFGSCSGKNGVCFSYLLMQYPSEAVDYVVVHELAHIECHNHSAAFYKLIKKYMPDYKQREKLLKK